MSFGARLHQAMTERGRLCVGIDPHPGLLHEWGLDDDPRGLEGFARTVVEALGEQVPVLKPQSAFFERHGSAGVAVLERVLADCRAQGVLTLLDVKRGDIGSTSQAYAEAYLDPASLLAADAVTVSPYLGVGALAPFFETATTHDAGVFVLALTSNPEGAAVQRARTRDGGSVAGDVLDHLRRLNVGSDPLGSFGAVVGATIVPGPEQLAIRGPLLAPGYGAQGGTVAGLQRVFGGASSQVLASSSREVLRAGPDVTDLRTVAARLTEELAVLDG